MLKPPVAEFEQFRMRFISNHRVVCVAIQLSYPSLVLRHRMDDYKIGSSTDLVGTYAQCEARNHRF